MTDKLTTEDIKGRKAINPMHFDAKGLSGWLYGVEGIPRLTLHDVTKRYGGNTTRTWHVDATSMPDLETALAVLNGEKTIESVMAEQQPKPNPTEPKSTLGQQIAEIERELNMRKQVYPRQVSGGKMRQSEADYKIKVMQDARDSLLMIKHILPTVLHRCEDVIAEARLLVKPQ